MTEKEFFNALANMIISGKEIDGTYRVDGDRLVPVENEEIPFTDDVCPYDGECGECPYERECAEDCGDHICDCCGECDYEPDFWGIPDIDHIVFSDPATIVFWEDGTKTVVKCMNGEKFERYAGFMAACMKKMFGSTSRAKAIMNECIVEQEPSKKKKKKKDDGVLPGQISVDEMISGDNTSLNDVIQEAINEALAK